MNDPYRRIQDGTSVDPHPQSFQEFVTRLHRDPVRNARAAVLLLTTVALFAVTAWSVPLFQ